MENYYAELLGGHSSTVLSIKSHHYNCMNVQNLYCHYYLNTGTKC